ncbi:hypothetical protein [Desulfitobacterium sp.]|uniref:hypothetical protein n=1 Tax=Desulfitobacterium sp. TaxID=49981 RepID=UPI002BC2DB71|nr:hypothetical protein [Desulfitobacterium sp.]HVJ49827.1 hypothetical protein [Desulfitobacterium sp.]
MRKFYNKCNQDFSLEHLANPFLDESIKKRYSKAKVVDMRDNYNIEKTKSGYLIIKPINPNKTY